MKFRLTPNISTFTAEMTGIFKALAYLKIHLPDNNRILILTDSKSTLQALEAIPKLRFDMHFNILKLISDLENSGYLITLLHIPSHVGIRGNEIADKAAYLAANDIKINITPIGYSRGEAYSLLRKAAPQAIATLREFPSQRGVFPPLSGAQLRVFRRIRTRCCRFYWQNISCPCGAKVNVPHLLSQCDELSPFTYKLLKYMNSKNLSITNMINFHKSLYWEPAKLLCSTICRSPLSHTF